MLESHHNDSPQAKLCYSKDCTCTPHQWHGGNRVYSRRGTQAPGALRGHRARWTRKGSWSPLSHCPRSPRCNGSREAQARPITLWSKASRGQEIIFILAHYSSFPILGSEDVLKVRLREHQNGPGLRIASRLRNHLKNHLLGWFLFVRLRKFEKCVVCKSLVYLVFKSLHH